MAKPLRPKRGTTAKNDAFVGLASEITIDTDKHSIRVHDGVTAGGHEILPANMIDVGVTTINGQKGNVTIDAVNKTGNRGTIGGYNTPAVTASAVSINADSNDDSQVTGAVAVTVSNGSVNQSWIKTVALHNASSTVSLGSSWSWVGGSAPEVTAKSILVLKWCGDFGLANLISGE